MNYRSHLLAFLTFLMCILPLFGTACTQSGNLPEDTQTTLSLDEPSEGRDAPRQPTFGFQDRDDGLTPPVDQFDAPAIDDKCHGSAAGNPLCYLVPVAIEGNIERNFLPVNFTGRMTMEYNASGQVTVSKLYQQKDNPHPNITKTTAYGPNGVKNNEIISHDTNADGVVEFSDTLEDVVSLGVSHQFDFDRRGDQIPDFGIRENEAKNIFDLPLFHLYRIHEAGQPANLLESTENLFTYDSTDKHLEYLNTVKRGQVNGQFRAEWRSLSVFEYNSEFGKSMVDFVTTYVLDCLKRPVQECLVPHNQFSGVQHALTTIRAETEFHRNPNREGRLDTTVSLVETKEFLPDPSLPINDPSHPTAQGKVTCNYWYLGSEYQIRELPLNLQHIIGREDLGPSTIACNIEGSQDFNVIRIQWAPLYQAAGLPPPQ